MNISLFVIGLTLDTLGKIMISLIVILVHHRVLKEHKIDYKVIKSMKKEQVFGLIGILLIIIGYLLQVIAI